ncbi:hypothetical protein FACS189442_5700 [Spirochaetia bacterium]|nr:hypothetical protein FACS189442_5700 [Spirochaetia bacterium]
MLELLKKLDRANHAIADSAVREVAGFLFPQASELEAELRSGIDDPYIRHLEFSTLFYRALAEAAEYNLKEI